MTDHFVRGHTEFADLSHYLAGYAVTGSRLRDLRFPAHEILADDDPVIPIVDLQYVQHSPLLHCERTRFGGHCGFISNWSFSGWIEQRIAEVLRTTLSHVRNTQATIAPSRERDHNNE
jgi:predicted alpha/beta-fold hydrolase